MSLLQFNMQDLQKFIEDWDVIRGKGWTFWKKRAPIRGESLGLRFVTLSGFSCRLPAFGFRLVCILVHLTSTSIEVPNLPSLPKGRGGHFQTLQIWGHLETTSTAALNVTKVQSHFHANQFGIIFKFFVPPFPPTSKDAIGPGCEIYKKTFLSKICPLLPPAFEVFIVLEQRVPVFLLPPPSTSAWSVHGCIATRAFQNFCVLPSTTTRPSLKFSPAYGLTITWARF